MQTEEQINEQIQALQKQKQLIRSRRQWCCPSCNRRTALHKLIVVQQWWYESPHGCMGGDNWWPSDDYQVWCNKCESWNRVYKTKVLEWQDDKYKQADIKRNQGFNFLRQHIQFVGEKLDNINHSSGFSVDELREQKRKRKW